MEGVSEFIVGTCQLHSKSFSDVFDHKQFPYLNLRDELEYDFLSGSSVEFYIEPMHSCVDDVDHMVCSGNNLAFTDDIPVLPDDMRGYLDTVNCFQIMPNPEYPGFVELRLFGKMRYNWICKKFKFQQLNDARYTLLMKNDMRLLQTLRDDNNTERRVAGPAIKYTSAFNVCLDVVPCIWCPQWPKEAKLWPSRRRNYGWPTSTNIQNVVESGCYIVHAKHPFCRNYLHQCRLSFSNAEFCLIQSWTPVQQIVYHMLRFFAKRELITKDIPKDDEVLCIYHLKTLMLWSCEEMSPEWWNSTSVVEICCDFLRKLSEWLKKRYCPNYFIPQANLFHNRMNQKLVDETMKRLNEFYNIRNLSGWFSVKYIKPILRKLINFGPNMEHVIDCGKYMLDVCQIMDGVKLKEFNSLFWCGFWFYTTYVFRAVKLEPGYRFRGRLSTICPMKNSLSVYIDDPVYFLSTVYFSSDIPQLGKVVLIMHTSIALRNNQTTYDSESFAEFIREVTLQPNVVRSKYHNFAKPSKTNLDRSGVLLVKAQDLMENLTGLNSPHEFKLVSQWSQELLKSALKCDDLHSRVIKKVASVYMAALLFSDSDYEAAIKFSSAVFIDKTRDYDEEEKEAEEQCQKETLNAGCLFFIDDIVRIIGVYLLSRRINDNFMYDRKRYLLDLRLNPEVFALLLIILSNERRNRPFSLSCDLQTPTFALDAILMTIIINRKSSGISIMIRNFSRVYQRTDAINKSEALNKSSVPIEDIIQLLMQYSLENMTSFYSAVCKNFNIHCNTVDCYRAAFLYMCRKYPEVLQLCERILSEPDLQGSLNGLTFADVMLLPPFDSFFGKDIECLLGFHALVCYPSSLNENFQKIGDNASSSFGESSDCVIDFWKARIKESHYFLGRHFLAKYLKLRCLMDCNHSSSEVLMAFAALKCHLPFEHIIRCFLLQKLRHIQY